MIVAWELKVSCARDLAGEKASGLHRYRAVADALRKNPVYDHYKGKQWWRACDNKSFQDLWICRGREPGKVKGEWGFVDVVAKIPANEELDRTCKEKGFA